MFDSLSGKLQNVFKNLRGLGTISDSNIADSLREVRMALLDADVNFKVARDFIERDLEIHVGVQQRHAHFAQRIGDVGVGNCSKTAQVFKTVLELAAQRIEHAAKVRFKVQSSKLKIVGCGLRVAGWRKTTFAFTCGRPATNHLPPALHDRNFQLERYGAVWLNSPSLRGSGRVVGYPSGQRGQTVNLLAYAFAGSNPAPTTTLEINANPLRDEENLLGAIINSAAGQSILDPAGCWSMSRTRRHCPQTSSTPFHPRNGVFSLWWQ